MSGVLNRTVMWVTMRQLFTRPRLITAIVVVVIPLILVLIFRATTPGVAAVAGGGLRTGKFLMGLYSDLVVGTLLPLTAIVFATSAFSAEVADGTIVYLLVKPEARWRIVASKYVVAVLATLAVIIPAIFLPWIQVDHAQVPVSVPLVFAGGVAVGALLYSALFLMLGLMSKRALVFGLAYIILVEIVLSKNAAGLKSFSIRELVMTAIGKIGEGNRWIGAGEVSFETVVTMGTLIFAGSLAFAWYKFKRFQLAEKL